MICLNFIGYFIILILFYIKMVRTIRYLKWNVNGGAYKVAETARATGHFNTTINTSDYTTTPGAIPTGHSRSWSGSRMYNNNAVSAVPQISGTTQNISYTIYFVSDWISGPDEFWLFFYTDTINQYSLTYDNNGGTLSGGTLAANHNYNATITLPTTKQKTGYTFNYFTKNGAIISGTSFSLPASNTIVKAIWTIKQYRLAYDNNGGTLSGGTPAGNHNYGAPITLPTTKQKTGYTFNYFTKSGAIISGTSFSLPASNTTTVKAIWTIKQYTVTYLSFPYHFGFTSTPNSYDYNTLLTDTIITIPIPRVIGEVYSFEKWTYNSSDLGESRLPPENINLVANWTSTNKDEIQMSELSTVFDNSSSFQNIKISNYFDRLKLDEQIDRENVDFLSKLKGRGTF